MGVFVYMRVFVEEILMFLQRQTGGGFGPGSGLPGGVGDAANTLVSEAGKIGFWIFLGLSFGGLLAPLIIILVRVIKNLSKTDEQNKVTTKKIVSDALVVEGIIVAILILLWAVYGAVPAINQNIRPG